MPKNNTKFYKDKGGDGALELLFFGEGMHT